MSKTETLNTYIIKLKGYGDDQPGHSEIAKSPAAAKYAAYLESESGCTFMEFCKGIESIRLVHKFRVADLFRDDNCFQRTIAIRGIPLAYVGMKVQLDTGGRGPLTGVICGANHSQNLDICFEGMSYKENCHPWHKLTYFNENGKIVYRFK